MAKDVRVAMMSNALLSGVVKSDPDCLSAALTVPMEALAYRSHRRVMGAAREIYEQGEVVDAAALCKIIDPSTVNSFMGFPPSLAPKRDARELQQAFEESQFREKMGRLAHCKPEELRDVLADIETPIGTLRRKAVDVAGWRNPAPIREWIFSALIPHNSLCGVIAQGGFGKSWLALITAVSIATGKSLLAEFRPARIGKVLWIESEDPPQEIHLRFKRLAEVYGLTEDDQANIEKNIRLYAGEGFALLDADGNRTDDLTWLRNEIREFQPDLIILDPFVHFFAGDENANPAVAAWCNAILDAARLSKRGPAVVVFHHTSKAAQNLSDSSAARGASSFRDAARCVLNLTPIPADDVAKYGIVDPTRFVRIEVTKSNYAAKPPKPCILQRGEGGVLTDFDADGAAKEISATSAERVSEALARELGANESDLSRRDIVSQPAGKWLRDLVKDACGNVTRKDIESALEYAELHGLIEVETMTTDGARRTIPRQRAATRTESLRDE